MRVIGLTGGIAMGKSTVAAHFRRARIPVFDADRAVHRLQGRGGAAVAPIGRSLPDAVIDGVVDRVRLRRMVAADPSVLPLLERILHPMVRDERRRFLRHARARGARLALLDVPLLFETGVDRLCDVVIVVSAPSAIQRLRLRRRGSMSDDQIRHILARQWPDAARRARADVVIHTGLSRAHADRQMRRLLHRLENLPGQRSVRRLPKKRSSVFGFIKRS